MNYDMAAEKYLTVRKEIEALERAHKEAKAELVEKQLALENWFTAKAQEDGLETVKTPHGTAYWSTHNTATVASREAFFSFCKEHDAWDMVESRASKTGVKSFIESHGEPPPGVNFSSTRVFNLRKAQSKE
jgi:predicted NAD/FAD-binding protein